MTVHARGYRRFTGVVRRHPWPVIPIFRHAYRDATRGGGFLTMRIFVLLFALVAAIQVVFQTGTFMDASRRLGTSGVGEAEMARLGLKLVLMEFHHGNALFVVLLALFVGSGLVADDLRTRALPLYLVRPLGPVDYFLGKWLVVPATLFVHVFVPGLFLVVLASLTRPSGEAWSFFLAQRDVLGVLVVHWAVVAFGYGSLVVLVSTLAKRRIPAFVFGTLAFMGGFVIALAASRVGGPLGDTARGLSLVGDGVRVLTDGLDLPFGRRGPRFLASETMAYGVPAALFLLCAFVVVRRARTTEVVS